MGKVSAVYRSVKKGERNRLDQPALFIPGFGLEGDHHGGRDQRQVCLFGRDDTDQIKIINGAGLCTGRFNENITTEGIELFKLPLGTRVKIGETIQEITQIGKKCFGCEIGDENGKCVLANEVVFTAVIVGGNIKAGDTIAVLV
ncbi:MOSC domain-containing protein [Acetobacterium wieringae]|uniref:MOSC domain protein n=1 Tax=Acetobacterium wieringae TaxID=52694 RepID=A0A1F2PF16_9FIRM|nr:MOSC domain-containing protein [Acetobacterium wieringae]OFV69863.1 MOSC domain protein [Acetobacterium wieringae]